jgi:hypothetical protein
MKRASIGPAGVSYSVAPGGSPTFIILFVSVFFFFVSFFSVSVSSSPAFFF